MKSSRIQAPISGALLLLCCSLALAQSPPPAPTVRISLVVPKGTNATSFQVVDNGVPHPAIVVPPSPSAGACKAPAPLVAAGAPTYTNCVPAPSAPNSSLVAIVIDWTSIPPARFDQVRSGVLRMLSALRPGDRAGLYSLSDTGLRVLHDCTMDNAALVDRAASFARANQDAAMRNQSGPNQIHMFEQALADPRVSAFADRTRENHLEATRSLAAIADHLAQFQVRKNVIWISGNSPYPMTLKPDADGNNVLFEPWVSDFARRRLVRAISDGETAIYLVHVRRTGRTGSPEVFEPGPPPKYPGANETRVARTRLRMGRDDEHPSNPSPAASFARMKDLAEFTGARAYHGTKDFAAMLREVIDDGSQSVSIAYPRSDTGASGRRHELRVRAEPSNTGVRYRNGYFDLPLGRGYRSIEMAEVLHSPLDATGLKLYVQLQPHPQTAGAYEVSVYVDAAGGTNRKLDLMVAEMPGDLRTKLVERTNVQPSRESVMNAASGRGVWLHRWFLCSANTRWLRIAVQDAVSGALGSVTIPLTANRP